ncbi:hypothetical protein SLEP1_g55257 [Rubroshorea leprosula]|uniref:Uncharacterized protein n=1 Tax=Rubroshorea leprosula TaxID=152421 RepID=A0AAV5MHC3_9ROSI|nr:hypothetical protein SLEP1_g55257 [Rubroshorea leprosula]
MMDATIADVVAISRFHESHVVETADKYWGSSVGGKFGLPVWFSEMSASGIRGDNGSGSDSVDWKWEKQKNYSHHPLIGGECFEHRNWEDAYFGI